MSMGCNDESMPASVNIVETLRLERQWSASVVVVKITSMPLVRCQHRKHFLIRDDLLTAISHAYEPLQSFSLVSPCLRFLI